MKDRHDELPTSAYAQPAVTEHGGRVELRLAPQFSNETTVCYAARWIFDGTTLEGWAYVDAPDDETNSPRIRIEAPGLVQWLDGFTRTLLRTSARSVLADNPSFSSAAWPRRLTRWRKDPAH